MNIQSALIIGLFSLLLSPCASKAQQQGDRAYWLYEMDRMARPVLQSLANDSLRIVMPQVTSKQVDNKAHRIQVQYVEILGRVLCGISPWLALEDGSAEEQALRKQYRDWTIQGLKNAVDSNARDFMRFDLGGQQLVDASFIAAAFVRCPWLWDQLDKPTQERLVNAIKTTRQFKPVFSNWLLFSAMNEAFLAKFGYDWDQMRVDYALRQLEQWYVGDAMYMDGPHYAYDYYNSFVIHPFLGAIMDVIEEKTKAYDTMFAQIKKRNQRYAIIQERLINSDGTFPPSGRSIIYRAAAFHHLADMARKKRLPEELQAGQVRGALTAVLRKTLESPSTYNNGWLTIGLYGDQPGLGDFYNNQGSPYLCSVIFLPLGLSAADDFWTAPELPWSAKKIWSGADAKKDYSIGF
ncbi:DUF2264 domain-containing protein [Sphingobacterium oryzagri]|uniref:DUF2264 domain-containing protein n=1 Tax=Sphingobacterium oryzagri TaxID=3025669 RepID=A0ABY7WIS0_9SPHI|nr:DUF2264 domain-containing protein [Sphingobacterium sp. KACC 22765]WDF68263.1 DUF2264 domain-containing protein [Sphingobacterium sp. KACC 22765]